MAIDIYHSRRTDYELCYYWIREEKSNLTDLSQWILKNKYSGMFYAKEENSLSNQENPIANTIMFDKNIISLSTEDDVDDLTRGCIILYDGKAWMVDNVQRIIHHKESQFSVEKHYKTIINIRR